MPAKQTRSVPASSTTETVLGKRNREEAFGPDNSGPPVPPFRIPADVIMSGAGDWTSRGLKPRTRRITQELDGATARARYGKSMKAVKLLASVGDETAKTMLKNRVNDEFYGNGRYGRRRMKGKGLYTGSGGFWSDAWQRSAGLRGKLGSGFKAAATAMGGAQYADALTRAEGVGRALGMGAYTVANDIVDGGSGQDIPTFSAGPTSVLISHKEYITDIFGPASAGTFQNTPYSINPGLERTFPWLSQVAANYEEYTLHQCIFTFRSTVTDFVATNGQVGTVIMASQYNPTDAPFSSKQDAMEYDMAMSGKVSGNMLHGVECDPAQLSGSPGKYVRAGPVRSDDDLKQYDHANLNVCISNIPQQFANQALGELWVSYTVELRKPKFFVSRGLNILRDAFVGQPAAGAADSYLSEMRFGYGQQNRIGGTWSASPAIGGAMLYTFPAGFSGSVCVRAIASALGLTTNSTLRWAVTCNNVDPFGSQTPGPGAPIQLIRDIFAEGKWVADSQAYTGTAGNPLSWVTCTTEIHLNVVSPSTAAATDGTPSRDNIIIFWFEDVAAVGNQQLAEFQLDVSVYNTAFNYASTGNLIVMNSVTDLQEEWP
jgi:hypothetical protein